MSKKKKHRKQPHLPDRQLAKVFNFTADDLEANRNGYLTWRQRNRSEDWLILLGQMLTQRLGGETLRDVEQRKNTVDSVCGRIHVNYELKEIHSARHTDIRVTCTLLLADTEDGFYITREQYLLLVNRQNIQHRIYFLRETGVVLSIERDQCPELEI